MKWFRKEKEIEKKNDKSTYLTVENGKVVPVVKNKEKPAEKEEVKRTPNPEEVEEKLGSRPMRWVWLIFIALFAYGTVHLYSQVTIESKEELKLQEVKRNTIETKTTPIETEGSKETVIDKAKNWKDDLQGSFEKETPKETSVKNVDQNVLFEIRQADEDGTAILQQVRDASVKHINGDMSRGQYILRLQSIDLKLNRYRQQVEAIEGKLKKGHKYNEHLEYVKLKEEALQSLIMELRIVQTETIASTFNNGVDFHNELIKEADGLFIEELKRLGYTVKIENGKIRYE